MLKVWSNEVNQVNFNRRMPDTIKQGQEQGFRVMKEVEGTINQINTKCTNGFLLMFGVILTHPDMDDDFIGSAMW